MSTYYTTFFVQPTPGVGEKIALGFALVDAERDVVFVDYSRRKLSLIGKLVPAQTVRNIRFMMASIVQRAAEVPAENTVKRSNFSQTYLQYLSAYLNNLVVADPPQVTDFPATAETFAFFFQRNVDPLGLPEAMNATMTTQLAGLKKRSEVREHFRTDARIDRLLDASIRFPVRVDLAGRNDRLTVAKLVATDRPARFIADDAHAFTSLLSQTPAAKHFLVAGEPDRATAPRQHQLWSNLREAFAAQYVDLNEFGRVEEYAREHGVRPLEISAEEE